MKIFNRSLGLGFATIAILSVLNMIAHSQAFGASESILWSFGKGSDGNLPVAGLIMDSNGNLFGTTRQGGANGGTVFELRCYRRGLDRVSAMELRWWDSTAFRPWPA